jgi:hypothetical protein
MTMPPGDQGVSLLMLTLATLLFIAALLMLAVSAVVCRGEPAVPVPVLGEVLP